MRTLNAKGDRLWLILVVIVCCIKELGKSALAEAVIIHPTLLVLVSKDMQVFSVTNAVVVADFIKVRKKSVLLEVVIFHPILLAVAMHQIQADGKICSL